MLHHSENRGFTLIELLVVISIIGLLSSVVMASLNLARAKARDSKRLRDISEIYNAIQLYVSDNSGSFPAPSTNPACLGLSSGTCWGGYVNADANLTSMLTPSYIKTLSADPLPARGISGDYYVYFNGTTPHGCTNDPNAMVTGKFIIWKPDKTTTGSDSDCLGKGFSSCCYAISCSVSYYCAYKVD